MHDAIMERLSKIISEPAGGGKEPRRPLFEVHLGLAEGWFSLILLAAVVYSTVWCVQAVTLVDHLGLLTPITALGLLIGVAAAKQKRFPSLAVHLCVIAFGVLFAFWQTAGAFYQGNMIELINSMQRWVVMLFTGNSSNGNANLLFFILCLGFVLAYTSAWLVYCVRNPWLMLVANVMVLLVNLNNNDSSFIVFLLLFLVASLLLLLRLHLYESIQRWQRQGLRYADDIGWNIMQVGTLISLGILVFSWLLPAGYSSDTVAQVWNADANPWTQFQNTWNRVVSVNGGVNPANHGNFSDTLVLSGNPNLTRDVVLTIQSDDPVQYLESLSYDTYTGRSWQDGLTANISLQANQLLLSGAALTHAIQQKITIVNPPGEQKAYLLGAPDIASVNVPANVVGSKTSYTIVAWLNHGSNLGPGMKYTVISNVSIADEQSLRSVPMPQDAPRYPPDYTGDVLPTVYDQSIVNTYLQLPKALDPNVAALARHISAQAPTMYDKVVALESYLRSNYTYTVNIQFPAAEQDAASWFLFRNGNKGYCTYFATAMAVMARTLGIPARVVAGYTSGAADQQHQHYIVRGVDAHSWTQVYFAGYGWINFEPSAGFAPFTRPVSSSLVEANSTAGGSLSGSMSAKLRKELLSRLEGSEGSATPAATALQAQVQLRQQLGLALGGFVLLVLFSCLLFALWWQRLFRDYDLPARVYGRVCLLANWAGIRLLIWQTPYEYMHKLALSRPHDAATLERLGDIYVRTRWAHPAAAEHPLRSGEINELPAIWKRLQPRLFLYVLRHPFFLYQWAKGAWQGLLTWGRRAKFCTDDL
ncbi:MAG: transglutaminase domain-containing protein [Ktedonobacteraceae bacterium]|nr:transglutaminase domain-containing protein [Ktedonobacteraceae bacterium]